MNVFDSLMPYFLDFGSDTIYYITKTAIPFSVCVALNFYNATFAEFSYTNVRIGPVSIIIEPLGYSSVTLRPNGTLIQGALIATVIS